MKIGQFQIKNDTMVDGSSLDKLAHITVYKTYKRRFYPTILKVHDGIVSSDPKLHEFQRNIFEYFEEKGVTNVDNSGVYESVPYADNYSSLLTLGGSLRIPLSFDKQYREVKIPADDFEILKEVINCFFKEPDMDANSRLSRDANSGFPFFTTNLAVRKAHLHYIVRNFDLFKRFVLERNFKSLIDKFQAVNVSTTQIRRQNDVWIKGKPKERKVVSFQQQFGHATSSPQPLSIDFATGLATCRTRVVNAAPGIFNYILTAAIEPVRKSVFRRYAATYITRSGEELCESLNEYDKYIGADVKAFDSSMPGNLIYEIIMLFPVSDLIKQIMLDLLFGAWYCSDIDGKGTRAVSQDVLEEPSTFKGNPSGWACTSLLNDIVATFCCMIEYKDKGFQVKGKVDAILKHEEDIAFKIKGDDQIHMARGRYSNLISDDFANKYVEVTKEQGMTYLGNMVYRDESGKLRTCFNPITYFSSKWIPEHSIGSHFRKFPWLGFHLRCDLHKKHPGFEEYYELEERIFRDIFRKSLHSYEAIKRREDEAMLLKTVGSFSVMEAEILLDPTKLHYKYDVDSLDPELVNSLMSVIDLRDTEVIRKECYACT